MTTDSAIETTTCGACHREDRRCVTVNAVFRDAQVPTCAECLREGAWPLWLLHEHAESIGGYDYAAPWFRSLRSFSGGRYVDGQQVRALYAATHRPDSRPATRPPADREEPAMPRAAEGGGAAVTGQPAPAGGSLRRLLVCEGRCNPGLGELDRQVREAAKGAAGTAMPRGTEDLWERVRRLKHVWDLQTAAGTWACEACGTARVF